MEHRLAHILLVAILGWGMVACTAGEALPDEDVIVNPEDPDDPENPGESGKETITATLADGADLFIWSASDYVAYWNGSSYVKSAAASPSGTGAGARIKVSYSGTRSDFAYYPYYLVQDVATDVNAENTLADLGSSVGAVILPDHYTMAQVSGTAAPCPMIADNNGKEWAFRHLCGLLKLSVNCIPAGTDKLVVAFDKDVTGLFTVSAPDSETPSISASALTDKNTITITLSSGKDLAGLVINIPVPAGNVSVTSVVAKADEDEIARLNAVVSGWNAVRATGKSVPSAFSPSMSGLVLAPGNLYTDGGKLAISSSPFTHFYNADNPDDYKPESYSAANRTHFNWNELYFLMASTGLTSMPAASDAATAHDGSYEGLSKSDFGDGYAWRVPSSQNWADIILEERPGATLTYTVGGSTPVTQSGFRFMRAMLTENDDPLESGGKNGILVFPDNAAITADFETLPTDCINGDKTSFNAAGASSLTRDKLESLVSQGCAFIPTAGMLLSSNYTFANGAAAANYYSSTEDGANSSKAFRARMQNKGIVTEQSYAKDGLWASVRLVRSLK